MSKMLKRDWENRYVRLKRDAQTNGGTHFKAGEVMLVDKNFGGLVLKATTHCPCCERHFTHAIRRVDERDVELLPVDFIPAPPIAKAPGDK